MTDLVNISITKRTPKRRGRPQVSLVARVTPSLSVVPDPANNLVCWIWTKPLTRSHNGFQRLRKTYRDGVLDNIFPENVRVGFEVPKVSREGKIDTLIRHLHREFIGEPPAKGRKTCGVFLCCNPWHWKASARQTQAELHAEALANRPPPEVEPDLDEDIEDLAEMMSSHWAREPTADFPAMLAKFEEDYEPQQVAQAALLAVERDCCPPAIRQTVIHAAHQALSD